MARSEAAEDFPGLSGTEVSAQDGCVQQSDVEDDGPDLSCLPDGIIAHVASYLPTPSKALFAVALTAPPSSWLKRERMGGQPSASETTRLLLSQSQWDALHFEDVGEDLAARLTNDDVESVLICIDAVHNLKELKLTLACRNVWGRNLSRHCADPTKVVRQFPYGEIAYTAKEVKAIRMTFLACFAIAVLGRCTISSDPDSLVVVNLLGMAGVAGICVYSAAEITK